MQSTYVSEIYASVQGEGPYTGEPQIFVRLAGCPFRCDYCDQPESLTAEGHKKMSVKDVVQELKELWEEQKIETISVTGGEPLAHGGFLKEFLPLLKNEGRKVYLETAGIHTAALSDVIASCDVIAMDIKLPSAIGKSYWAEHKAFLSVGREKVFAKIVLEDKSRTEELQEALAVLMSVSPPPLLVLQPATSVSAPIQPPSPQRIEDIYQLFSSRLPQVRVMPQQHKIWGIR